MGGQLAQPPQLLTGFCDGVALNDAALPLQGEQVLWPQLGHHPLAPCHREPSNGSPRFPRG